jgi:hypothetical protein
MADCMWLEKRGGEGTEKVRYVSNVVDDPVR